MCLTIISWVCLYTYIDILVRSDKIIVTSSGLRVVYLPVFVNTELRNWKMSTRNLIGLMAACRVRLFVCYHCLPYLRHTHRPRSEDVEDGVAKKLGQWPSMIRPREIGEIAKSSLEESQDSEVAGNMISGTLRKIGSWVKLRSSTATSTEISTGQSDRLEY